MAPGLFFAGSVEEAVHKSVQEEKYFVAFVTGSSRYPDPPSLPQDASPPPHLWPDDILMIFADEDQESNNWEFDFLPEFHDFLSERGVTLRIIKGSQAAANLASLFPIPKFPTIVIIQ